MGFLEFLLLIIAAIPVLSIVIIYFVATQSADIQFTPYDPYQGPPPPDIWDYICRRYAELQPLGFQVTAYLYQTGQVKGFTTSVTLLKNPHTGDGGAIIAIYGTAGLASTRQNYVEFSTEFENGVEVNTNNSKTLGGTYARPATKFQVQYPDMQNAAELFQIHSYLCWKHGRGASKVLPPDGRETEDLVRSCYKELNHQAQAGMMRLSGGRYRPTVKGAAVMTLKNLWPVSAIRRAKARREARRLLAEMRNQGFQN